MENFVSHFIIVLIGLFIFAAPLWLPEIPRAVNFLVIRPIKNLIKCKRN